MSDGNTQPEGFAEEKRCRIQKEQADKKILVFYY